MHQHGTTLPASAYELIRQYPLEKAERLWSAGKTIRAYPEDNQEPPPPPWEDTTLREHHKCYAGPGQLCAIDRAELDHLIATQEPVDQRDHAVLGHTVRTTDTTIEQELRKLGYASKSLDAPITTPDGNEFDIAERHLGITPLVRPTPLQMRRIEWERRTKLSGRVTRLRMRPTDTGSKVEILGPTLTSEQRIEYGRKYLARLKRELGYIPTADQIREWHTRWQELRQAGRAPNLANHAPYAEEDWRLATYDPDEEDPYREALTATDQELHDVALVTIPPSDTEIAEAKAEGRRATPQKAVITRTRPPAYEIFDFNPTEILDRPDPSSLWAYYETVLAAARNATDYLASQAAIGLDHELAMSEWDLGQELEEDLDELPDLAVQDEPNPLSILKD